MSSRKTKPDRGRKILLPIIVLVLLFACSFGLVAYKRTEAPALAAPATATATLQLPTNVPTQAFTPTLEPTSLPTDTPVPEQLEVVTYTPTENAVPLVSEDETIGFFWVLNKNGPTEVVYPSQSTVLVTLGNAWVSPKPAMEIVMTSDGTQGNIFVDVCETAEDCKLTVSEYSAGHVGVTIVFAGKEKPAETLAGAINNMFEASNCGGSGCLEVIVHNDKNDPAVSHFETKVVAADVTALLTIPAAPFVSVAIVGEPPANAEVIKIDKKVVGHSYTCSGECFVSVPEGAGGTVACFSEGGTADGKAVNSGEIVSWNGADSDGGTPEDLNNTVLLNGNNIQIMMIYMADLEPFMNVACGQ